MVSYGFRCDLSSILVEIMLRGSISGGERRLHEAHHDAGHARGLFGGLYRTWAQRNSKHNDNTIQYNII